MDITSREMQLLSRLAKDDTELGALTLPDREAAIHLGTLGLPLAVVDTNDWHVKITDAGRKALA